MVDQSGDPAPGDPERVKRLAGVLEQIADDAAEARRTVRNLLDEDRLASFVGLTAEAFKDRFEKVPPNLDKLTSSYELAAEALSEYWPKLTDAQRDADTALVEGRSAAADLASARSTLEQAVAELEDAEDAAEDPDEAEITAGVREALRRANSDHTAAESAVTSAESMLAAAKGLAAQARETREDAARNCARKLEEASDAGIQNKKWWQKAVDWVVDNWDAVVAVAKVVVAVLGIVVMIIGGPLAWIVLAAALIVLADSIIKYANGEGTLWDVGFAALDCIPGFKGITTAAGLARGLSGGVTAVRAGLPGVRRAMGDAVSNFRPQRVVHADSMNPADAQRFVDTNYPWLKDVNNTGARNYTDNCSNCVVAVDRRLDGVEVSAAPLENPQWPNQQVLGADGMKYEQVAGYDDITQDLLRRGEGSRSIVYIGRPDGTAHVFNAVNSPQGVVYLDGQTGQLGRLENGVSAIAHLPYR